MSNTTRAELEAHAMAQSNSLREALPEDVGHLVILAVRGTEVADACVLSNFDRNQIATYLRRLADRLDLPQTRLVEPPVAN